MQFAYNSLRCTVEFDQDHSRSNSMRRPALPDPTDHLSMFSDTDLLPEPPNAEHEFPVIADTLGASLESSGAVLTAKISLQSTSTNKENTESAERTDVEPSRNKRPLVLDVKPPPLQTVVESGPLKERDPNHVSRCAVLPMAVTDIEHSSTLHLQALETTHSDVQNLAEARQQENGVHTNYQATNVPRQPGEESQILGPSTLKGGRPGVRPSVDDTQTQENHVFKYTNTLPRQLGQESRVLSANPAQYQGKTMRQAGEESRIIAQRIAISTKELQSKRLRPTQNIKVRNTNFVDDILKGESGGLPSKRVSFDVPTESSDSTRKTLPLVKDTQTAKMPKAKPDATLRRDSKETTSKMLGSDRLSTESPDVLAPSVPRKRSASEVLSSQSSPSKSQKRDVSLSSQTADDSTDISAASEMTAQALKSQKKRRQSPGDNTDLLQVPLYPTVMLSSNCEVQKKKKHTMETFLQLGVKVTEKISEADVLCVSNKDGLKKTSKLILAVIYGKIIVTESWLVQCTRSHKIVHPGSYQPKDKAKEAEWSVKFPAALNRGRLPNANLDHLFQGHNFYLTPQLQKQLSDTNNLDGFTEVAMAMGANSVRKRLPVKAGSKMIVLGIAGDFDALAIGKLGLALYDKDLLTISALRGRKEDDKDEFKIDIPIKEEEMSQG